eukprot:Gb_26148 [translate_table: standard]
MAPHALVVPHPVQGHINPMIVLSQILASKGIVVTFVNTHDTHTRITKSAAGSKEISFSQAPGIRIAQISDGLPLDFDRSANFDEFVRSVDNMGSALEDLIHDLNMKAEPPISCVIADSFLPWTLDVAKKFNLPWVFFWTQSIASYVLYNHLPHIISNGHFPPTKWDEEIKYIQGLPTMQPQDLPSFIQKGDRSDLVLQLIFRQFELLDEADCIIGNAIYELESEASDAVESKAPMWSVGPLLPSVYLNDPKSAGGLIETSLTQESNCLPWLDSKPKSSVLYVSYGSLVHMSKAQLEEIALGLLESKQFFLWVLRVDIVASNAFDILPSGFLEGAKDQGLVIPWSPQLKVLSHPSVGGFFSHCGWNSTIESVSLGVPVLSFPQWSDQYTNRMLLVDQWKVGLKLKQREDGIVDRGQVARAVKALIEGDEGKEMRQRAGELRNRAKKAVMKGGSSFNNLEAFAHHLSFVEHKTPVTSLDPKN